MVELPAADPRTADTFRSIWRGIPETTFRTRMVELEKRTNGVPADPESYSVASWIANSRQKDSDRSFSIDTEVRLADAIAFLAASDEGVNSVAAVCVEERISPPGLTFRVAANEGVESTAQATLENVAELLTDCAAGSEVFWLCALSMFLFDF